MTSLGVIPARLASTRLPEKALHKLAGQEMVLRVWQASQSSNLDKVVVATDSQKIYDLVTGKGGEAVMTSPDCPTGSDRVLEAVQHLGGRYDIVFNIQGDEPLLDPEDLNRLLALMRERPEVQMGTLARALEPEEIDRLDQVKVIVNNRGEAIYFSRLPIPFSRERNLNLLENQTVMSHIGMYAFRTDCLVKYCSLGPTDLERAESLEQLRVLWMGEKIIVVPTENLYRGVDTLEDALAVERILQKTEQGNV